MVFDFARGARRFFEVRCWYLKQMLHLSWLPRQLKPCFRTSADQGQRRAKGPGCAEDVRRAKKGAILARRN